MNKRSKQYLALLMSFLLVFSTFEFTSIALDNTNGVTTTDVEEVTDPPAEPEPAAAPAPADETVAGSENETPSVEEEPVVTEEPESGDVKKADVPEGGSDGQGGDGEEPAADDGEGDIPENEANTLPGEPQAVGGLVYSGSDQELITRGEPKTVRGRTYYWLARIEGDSEWHTSIPKATEAGTYTVEYKLSRYKHWKGFRYGTVTVTISPAELDLVWNDQSVFTYDGEQHSPSYTLYGIQGGNVPYLSYWFTGSGGYASDQSPTEPGKYKMTVSLPDSESNYTMDTASKRFAIVEEREEPQGRELTYDGKKHALATDVNGYLFSLSEDGKFSTHRPTAKDAGEYTVYYKYGRKGEVKSLVTTISPAELTATWSEQTYFVYDEAQHSPELTIEGVVGRDDPQINYRYIGRKGYDSDEAPSKIGRYLVKASLAEDEINYTMADTSKHFMIVAEKDEPLPRDLTYDGKSHALATDVDGYLYSLSEDGPFSTHRPTAKDAGNYEVFFRYGPKGTVKSVISTISPAELSVSWEEQSVFVYNGEPQAPEATVTGMVAGESDPTVRTYAAAERRASASEPPTEVGNYKAIVSLPEDVTNYKLDPSEKEFSIINEPAPEPEPETDGPQARDRVYDGHRHYLVSPVRGYMYSLSEDGPFSYRRPTAVDADVYTVYYKYGRNGDVKSVDVKVSPAILNLVWDDDTDFDYDGNPHAPGYTLNGVMDGDDPEIVVSYSGDEGELSGAPSEAGEYTASAELSKEETNYTMQSSSTGFTIIGEGPEPEPTREEPQAINRTYDGSRQPLVTYVRGYMYSMSPDRDFSRFRPRATNAGTYIVYYRLGRFGDVKSVEVTIDKAVISLVWGDEREFDYDGNPHTPGYTLNGVVDGDDPDVVVTYTGEDYSSSAAPVMAGEYSASAELSPDETNYVMPMHPITTTFTITGEGPEPGPVPAGPQAIDRIYDGSTQPLVTRVSGYLYSLTPDGDFSSFRPRAKDAGEYTVYYKYGEEGVTGSVVATISKRPLTVVWNEPFEYTYDGEGHAPTARLRGRAYPDRTPDFTYKYLDQDRSTVLEGKPVNANSKGNNYTAVVELDPEAKNYQLDTDTASHAFVINPKKIGIEWGDTEFTYDGNAHVPTATATGVIEGDTCNIPVIVEGDEPAVNAGDYTARVGSLDNPNYAYPADADPETPFKINPADITIQAKDKEIYYNDPAPALIPVTDQDVEITGIPATGVAYDYSELVLKTDYKKGDDAGTYPIYVNFASEIVSNGVAVQTVFPKNPNYNVVKVIDGKLIVKHIPDVVAPQPVVYYYNGQDQKLAVPGSAGEGFEILYACGETRPADDSSDWSADINMATNVGDYQMWWRPARKRFGSAGLSTEDVKNDLDKGGSFVSKILPLPVNITWSPLSFTYNGDLHCPSPTITNLIANDECIVIAGGAASEPGTHTAKAISLSNKNYTLEGGTGITADYTIIKSGSGGGSDSGSVSGSSDSSDDSGSSTETSGYRTGDSSHILVWLFSLIVAAAAAAGLVIRRRFRDLNR